MRKTKAILVGSVLVSVLSACSSYEGRKQANKGFDYLDAELTHPVQVDGLAKADVYDIPPLGSRALPDYVGEQVDVRAPAQVLPVLDGTRVNHNDDGTSVSFNTRGSAASMGDEVWGLLINFLARYNVTADGLDRDAGILTSGYFEFEEEYGSYLNKTDYRSREKYRFRLNESASGRSASLNVELLDFNEWIDGDKRTQPLLEKEKQRYETGMINRVLVYGLEEKHRRDMGKIAANTRVPLELGFDSNDLPAWVSPADFDLVWNRLPQVLELLNFEILSADKILGSYKVNYKAPSDSYWREKRLRPFDLKRGEYLFQLGETDKGETVITIFDRNGKALPLKKVSELYISFADVMRNRTLSSGK